jgi:IS5 family transposase
MQRTFADAEYDNRKKETRKEKFLRKMEEMLPWEGLMGLIEPHYYNKKTGRPPVPLGMMLRMYLIQIWYSLSDPATEDAIYENYAFRKFVGVDFNGKFQVPDETCLVKFRHLLEKHKLGEKIFELINHLIEKSGLIMHGGTIVDATIIDAPKSTKNKGQKRDEEMASTKKAEQSYFGSKIHIGADAGSGLVHSFTTTAANHHDITETHNLIRKDDHMCIGDSGYVGVEKRDEIRVDEHLSKVDFRIVQRPSGRKKMGEIQKWWAKQMERPIIGRRQKIEYVFHVIKNIFHYRKNAYKGLAKNHQRTAVLLGMANLYMLSIAGRNLGC